MPTVHPAQRRVLEGQGLTQPGGGGKFPIPNREYLRRAIQAYGRSATPGATKAWIIRRAHDLKATDLLPESWGMSPAENARVVLARRSQQ